MVNVKLVIWGRLSDKRIISQYLQGTHGLILLFDLTRLATLTVLLDLAREAVQRTELTPAVILVGTKSDLTDERQVGETEIAEVRNQLRQEFGHEVQYVETSAKTGANVEWVFEALARDMLEAEAAKLSTPLGETEESLAFKVVILGSPGVGSTALLHRLVSGQFLTSYMKTIGAQFITKELDLEPPRMEPKPLRAEEKKAEEAMSTSSAATPTPPAGPPASAPSSPGGAALRKPAAPAPSQPPAPAPESTTSEGEVPSRAKSRRTSRPSPAPLEDEVALEMPEEVEEEADEERMITDGTLKDDELPEARIVRETAVSYYDRMNPQKNYPLRVKVSKKQIILEAMDEVRHVEGRLEVERDEQELPLVRVVPVFPGCIVTPQATTVNIDQEQTIFFYITPLALGKVDGRVEFWYRGQRVAFNETPTVVEKQTIAKIFAVVGMAVGVVPSALEFIGFSIQEFIQNQLAMNRPVLKNLIDSIGGMVLAQVGFLAICLLLGGYFFYLKRPHQTDLNATIAYS